MDVLIKGYTINGARQLRWQDKMGSLSAGKLANFVVIDKDPFEVSEDEIKDIRVEAVVFDGKLIKGSLENI